MPKMMTNLMFLMLLTVLVFATSVFPQTVANGWEISGSVPVGDSLWGAFDLIVDLDLDNDGNKEFIVSRDPSLSGFLADRTAPQFVEYYESTGDNQFELRWSFQAPFRNSAGNVYTAIVMGDLDADQKPELYFGTPLDISADPPNPRGLYVFEFDGSNFPATPSETWNFGRPDNHVFKVSGMAVGDVDGDGEQELVVQSRGDDGPPGNGNGRTMMVVNSGNLDIGSGFAAFQVEFENSLNHTGGVVYDPRVVDFDGDGANEIWVFTWDLFSLAIYESTGNNSYALQTEIDQVFPTDDFGHRRGMRFYDADQNGSLEFYTSGIQPDNGRNGYIFYMGSTSDVATLSAADVVKLGGRSQPADGSTIGDVDGNGLMDLLYTGRAPGNDEGTRIYRMEYSGSGPLADSTSYSWTMLYESESMFADLRNVAITDLDSDGKTEVIVARMGANNAAEPILIVLENTLTALEPEPDNAFIAQYELRQNYPNPFNPQTSIKFTVKTAGEVKLTVYNVTGQAVAELVRGYLPAGNYSYAFDGSGMSSGVYFYTLESGQFRATRSMALIR